MARLKQVPGASGRAPPPLVEDGPPDIQTIAILDRDGATIRDPMVESTDWRDPNDDASHLRRHGARYIRGFRHVWTIHELHKASPGEMTARHVAAASRFLNVYEMQTNTSIGERSMEYVDGGEADMGPMEMRIKATELYQEALVIMGQDDAKCVFHTAILNRSLTDTAHRLGIRRDNLQGRLCSALGRLADHYWPRQRASTIAASMPEPEPAAERLGRWRQPSPAGSSR